MREPVIFKTTDGDKQLTFKIYPFPATKSEDLLIRILLLTGKNLDLDASVSYKEIIRALASVPHMEAKALLDELLTCVYKVDGNNERQFSYDDADGYISNPMTLIRLRVESLKVNFSFFQNFEKLFSHAEPSS